MLSETLTDHLPSPRSRTLITAGILAIIGAIFARYAVPFAFQYSMSFLPMVVAAALFWLYAKKLAFILQQSRDNLRLTIVSALTALLFSLLLVIGSWSICDDSGALGPMHIVATIINGIPLYALIILLMRWLDQRSMKMEAARSAGAPCAASARKRTVIIFLTLLICWLPVFLAAFPGFFTCDMTTSEHAEYTQYIEGELNAEYPTLHVLLLGSIITFVSDLTGSFNSGVAAFIILQALMVSAIFTFIVNRIAQATRSRLFTILTVAYLAFDPIISIFVVCTTRDTPFSAFTVLLAILLFVWFDRNRKRATEAEAQAPQPEASDAQAKERWKLLAAIALTSLAVCFFRPNGIIAIIVLIPFLILFEHGARARIQMGATCAAILAACWLWFGPIAGALGVQPSPTARLLVLSLPAQQITYVVEEGDLLLSESAMLEAAGFGEVNEDGAAAFWPRDPQLADSARRNLAAMSTPDVIEAYITLGLNHPEEYFQAFIDQTQAAWNPYAYGRIYDGSVYAGSQTSVFSFSWDLPSTSQTLLPPLYEALRSVSRTLDVQNVPLFSLLLSLPFYLWIVILLIARAIITLDRRIAAPCVLFAMLTITVFFGPCEQFRYYLFLFFGLPIMLMLLAQGRATNIGGCPGCHSDEMIFVGASFASTTARDTGHRQAAPLQHRVAAYQEADADEDPS